MKVKVYMRVGKMANGRLKVLSGVRKSDVPLKDSSLGTQIVYYPTISFALWLDLPADAFDQASKILANITIPEDGFDIPADVKVLND